MKQSFNLEEKDRNSNISQNPSLETLHKDNIAVFSNHTEENNVKNYGEEWVGWVRPDNPPQNQRICSWNAEKVEKVDCFLIEMHPPPDKPACLTPTSAKKTLAVKKKQDVYCQEKAALNLKQTTNPCNSSLPAGKTYKPEKQKNSTKSRDFEVMDTQLSGISLQTALENLERRHLEMTKKQIEKTKTALEIKDRLKLKVAELEERLKQAEEMLWEQASEREDLRKKLVAAEKEKEAGNRNYLSLMERIDEIERELSKKDEELDVYKQVSDSFQSIYEPNKCPSPIVEVDEDAESDSEDDASKETQLFSPEERQLTISEIDPKILSAENIFLKTQNFQLEHTIQDLLSLLAEQENAFAQSKAESDETQKRLEDAMESQLQLLEVQHKESLESINYLSGVVESLEEKVSLLKVENHSLKKRVKASESWARSETSQKTSPEKTSPDDLLLSHTNGSLDAPHKNMPPFTDEWFNSS